MGYNAGSWELGAGSWELGERLPGPPDLGEWSSPSRRGVFFFLFLFFFFSCLCFFCPAAMDARPKLFSDIIYDGVPAAAAARAIGEAWTGRSQWQAVLGSDLIRTSPPSRRAG
ncbi:hypothetical protein BDZ91DRAFT_784770 [Kalaharituber pfeilii]|nr:hypothetical protein BDZ91DRAFT_784770 [Kalaharituber pfeilii]